jgi:hypothetical protein
MAMNPFATVFIHLLVSTVCLLCETVIEFNKFLVLLGLVSAHSFKTCQYFECNVVLKHNRNFTFTPVYFHPLFKLWFLATDCLNFRVLVQMEFNPKHK